LELASKASVALSNIRYKANNWDSAGRRGEDIGPQMAAERDKEITAK